MPEQAGLGPKHASLILMGSLFCKDGAYCRQVALIDEDDHHIAFGECGSAPWYVEVVVATRGSHGRQYRGMPRINNLQGAGYFSSLFEKRSLDDNISLHEPPGVHPRYEMLMKLTNAW